MSIDRSNWPFMVRIGLWRIQTRSIAWAFVAGSIIIAIACGAYSFVNPRFLGGTSLFLAALWYYLAIKWVDKNKQWNSSNG